MSHRINTYRDVSKTPIPSFPVAVGREIVPNPRVRGLHLRGRFFFLFFFFVEKSFAVNTVQDIGKTRLCVIKSSIYYDNHYR